MTTQIKPRHLRYKTADTHTNHKIPSIPPKPYHGQNSKPPQPHQVYVGRLHPSSNCCQWTLCMKTSDSWVLPIQRYRVSISCSTTPKMDQEKLVWKTYSSDLRTTKLDRKKNGFEASNKNGKKLEKNGFVQKKMDLKKMEFSKKKWIFQKQHGFFWIQIGIQNGNLAWQKKWSDWSHFHFFWTRVFGLWIPKAWNQDLK